MQYTLKHNHTNHTTQLLCDRQTNIGRPWLY